MVYANEQIISQSKWKKGEEKRVQISASLINIAAARPDIIATTKDSYPAL